MCAHQPGEHGAETLRSPVAVLSTPQSNQWHLPQSITLDCCQPSHLPAAILPLIKLMLTSRPLQCSATRSARLTRMHDCEQPLRYAPTTDRRYA
jgi:hypothetical protein